MVIKPNGIKNIGELKKDVNVFHKCPICKEDIQIGVEWEMLQKLHEDQYFPYPHIHLHGKPLHAMLCYIDKDLRIRNVGKIYSIEVSRDSDTLSELMKKWSNPY